MREVRRDKRTTATTDMPSSCQMEIPKRTQERKKPRKTTMVRGARVLALRGLLEVRRMETTRMECSGQELASLYLGG
jgi:hypothetical protein